jgi:manganese/zinc/iron transport system permease protein
MYNLFSHLDYTLVLVSITTGILGSICGVLGTFACLRKQSLFGDAIAHAALPGIASMFLLTNSKNPALLLVGGIITGAIGTLFMEVITSKTKLKNDAALGIVLSVFFGIGLVLISIIQKKPNADQAILNKFLFGCASTILLDDMYLIMIVSCIIALIIKIMWKEFKLITFDAEFAYMQKFPVYLLHGLLTTLILIIIVMGLQTVGVILISSLLIAPAAAALQWTKKLEATIITAACCGALASIIGSHISTKITHMPTGPIIVVVLSIMVAISLLCSRYKKYVI